MLISLVSSKGSPGASVLALALAMSWPRPVLLAECDPRGGDLVWGFGQGAATDGKGLLSLQVAAREQPMGRLLWNHVIGLDRPLTWALPGLDEPRQARGIAWGELARVFAGLGDVDVIADCGVVPAVWAPSAVWESADLVVMPVRSTLRSSHATEGAAQLIREQLRATGFGADRLHTVAVGPGNPYPVGDLKEFFQNIAPLLGSVAWDPGAAEVFSDGAPAGRRLQRSSLMRSAAELAEVLGTEALKNRDRMQVLAPAVQQQRGPVFAPGASMNGGGWG